MNSSKCLIFQTPCGLFIILKACFDNRIINDLRIAPQEVLCTTVNFSKYLILPLKFLMRWNRKYIEEWWHASVLSLLFYIRKQTTKSQIFIWGILQTLWSECIHKFFAVHKYYRLYAICIWEKKKKDNFYYIPSLRYILNIN